MGRVPMAHNSFLFHNTLFSDALIWVKKLFFFPEYGALDLRQQPDSLNTPKSDSGNIFPQYAGLTYTTSMF